MGKPWTFEISKPSCDTLSLFEDNACPSGSDIWAVLTTKLRTWKGGQAEWLGRQGAQARYLKWRVLQDHFRGNVSKANVVGLERCKKRHRLLFKSWMLMLPWERPKKEDTHLHANCDTRCESKLQRTHLLLHQSLWQSCSYSCFEINKSMWVQVSGGFNVQLNIMESMEN